MLFVPVALLGYGGYVLAKRYDDKVQQLEGAAAEMQRHIPISNRYATAAQTQYQVQRQPVRVIPDVDLHGVPMYHVDYGSGVRTREYARPAYLTGYPQL